MFMLYVYIYYTCNMYSIYMIHDKKHQKGNLLGAMVSGPDRAEADHGAAELSRGFPHNWDHRMGVLNIRGMGLCT